jgi:outer membrane protein TolC
MKIGLVLLVALTLAGCTSLSTERNLERAGQLADTGASPAFLDTAEARSRARAGVDARLAAPITADDAVALAVGSSAAVQAQLFESSAASAGATRSARLPNPVFTFERLVRKHDGEVDKDIGRLLSFSLFELLTLPARIAAADARQQHLTLRAAGDLVQAATDARQAWVRAVAAEQAVKYAGQVKESAEAGAELARRMQAVGNFSKLQRAREQAFYAEATAQLARARHQAAVAREALVRVLGLDAAQAARLRLPDRLPDLPAEPRDAASINRSSLEERLDVRLARAELDEVARREGLTRVTSYVDGLHLGIARNSETGEPPQRGYEIELPLPLFDFGDARRAQARAEYLAALNRAAAAGTSAASQVREAYSAYRTAYDLARHYRDEVVPLRKAMADEMLLKYNGMLIGVFELLADSREQVAAVNQALDAERDFWLAEAALRAALIGRPVASTAMNTRTAAPAAGGH